MNINFKIEKKRMLMFFLNSVIKQVKVTEMSDTTMQGLVIERSKLLSDNGNVGKISSDGWAV